MTTPPRPSRAPSFGAALFALPASAFAQAQTTSPEIGAATVWFALLVVVFALLVSVGLFMAHDDQEANEAQAAAERAAPSHGFWHGAAAMPAHAHGGSHPAGREQQQEIR